MTTKATAASNRTTAKIANGKPSPGQVSTSRPRPLACHARIASSDARPSSLHTGQTCSDSIHAGLFSTGMRRATEEIASRTPHTRHRMSKGSNSPAARAAATRVIIAITAHRGGLPALVARPTTSNRMATTRMASHGFLAFQRCPLLSSQELRGASQSLVRQQSLRIRSAQGRPQRPWCERDGVLCPAVARRRVECRYR